MISYVIDTSAGPRFCQLQQSPWQYYNLHTLIAEEENICKIHTRFICNFKISDSLELKMIYKRM